AIAAEARRLGMVEVLWSVDSGDSIGGNFHQIAARVRRGIRPGSIVLMHENRGQTIRALRSILPYLRRRRLRPVSVPELLAADPPSRARLRAGEGGCAAPRSGASSRHRLRPAPARGHAGTTAAGTWMVTGDETLPGTSASAR